MELWKKINYTPDNAEYGSDIFEEGVDDEQVGGVFTPAKAPSRGEQKFTGVTITRFPKNTDPGKIMEFLCRSTLPEEKKEEVLIKENGVVAIKNLTSDLCLSYVRYLKEPCPPSRTIRKRSYKTFDPEAYISDMSETDFTEVYCSTDVDEAAEILTNRVVDVLDKHAPWIVYQQSKHYTP